MATISLNALVTLGATDLQRALVDIHGALVDSRHFRPIYALDVPATNRVIEDMMVGWVRFGHLWSSVGAYVENYAQTVKDLMDPNVPLRDGMPEEVILETVWTEWANTLNRFQIGA